MDTEDIPMEMDAAEMDPESEEEDVLHFDPEMEQEEEMMFPGWRAFRWAAAGRPHVRGPAPPPRPRYLPPVAPRPFVVPRPLWRHRHHHHHLLRPFVRYVGSRVIGAPALYAAPLAPPMAGTVIEGGAPEVLSSNVLWAQRALNLLLPASIPEDGVYSGQMRQALIDFQGRARLATTGLLNGPTLRALQVIFAWSQTSAGAAPPPEAAASGQAPPEQGGPAQTAPLPGPKADAERESEGEEEESIDFLWRDEIAGEDLQEQEAPPPPAAPPLRSVQTHILNRRGRRREIIVHESIAKNVQDLLDDAKRAGILLGGGGYRSSEAQIRLRRAHCGSTDYDIYQKPAHQCSPQTARPGTSMHERGLAIDFTGADGIKAISRASKEHDWLRKNAHRYGLQNLRVKDPRKEEPWHWSVNGR